MEVSVEGGAERVGQGGDGEVVDIKAVAVAAEESQDRCAEKARGAGAGRERHGDESGGGNAEGGDADGAHEKLVGVKRVVLEE